jgi:hypothetical protein
LKPPIMNITDDAVYWRSRAAEARAVAVQMKDAHTRAVMLGIAQDYEKLAVRAEGGRRFIAPRISDWWWLEQARFLTASTAEAE